MGDAHTVDLLWELAAQARMRGYVALENRAISDLYRILADSYRALSDKARAEEFIPAEIRKPATSAVVTSWLIEKAS